VYSQFSILNSQFKALLYITILATSLHALPVGDPRTPDEAPRRAIPVEQGVHELSLHAFMGASKINYPDMSGTQFSPGFGAGFSYSYFFSPRWSFLTGGGIQLFNNRGTDVNGDWVGTPIEDANDFSDGGSDRVTLFYDFNGYSEKQWSLMAMIPIMFQYQSNESRNKAFYYAIGAKIGIPFAGSYEGVAKSAKVCGYYPDRWGAPPDGYNFSDCNRHDFGAGSDDPNSPNYNEYAWMGFGDFGRVSSHSKLKLSTAVFAAVEAGVKWRLYNKFAVYTGFWMDWGLNDIAIRAIGSQPFTWEPLPENEDQNSKTPSAKISFRSRTEGRAIPVSLGFTVRFALGAGSHYEVADSVRWIREIIYRDSILDNCFARLEKMRADSAANADSLAMLKHRADALMASNADQDALKRQLDSLEALRKADLERARLAALEQARRDSIERHKLLEASRASRLQSFHMRLGQISNGLDDYSITQTVPSERAVEKLDTAGVLLRDYPDLRIRITGHTCDKGTYEANKRIGLQRAQSAKNYLVNAEGISPNRIETATKANDEPRVPNTSEDNRRKNRRVQIEIIEGIEKIEQEAK